MATRSLPFASAFVLAVFAVMTVSAQDRPARSSTLAGTWLLDPYVSDHPEQVARLLRFATGEARVRSQEGARGRGEGRGEGREGFGGFGGFDRDRGARAGQARGEAPRNPISEADRKLLDELTASVRFAPTGLVITQSADKVTISPDGGNPLVLPTNGHGEKQPLSSGTVDRRAEWEGPVLIVTYEVGKAGNLIYHYERAPTTGQLVVRVSFAPPLGTELFEIKLVYDPGAPAGPAASDQSARE